MGDSSTSVDWAVISFVEKSEISEKNLLDFFTKLNQKLHKRAETKFLSLSFAEFPQSMEYVWKNDYDKIRHVLKQMRANFPNCIVLYSILSHRESEEYSWIKQITNEFGFARQCILKENVETCFEKCSASVDDVCDNIVIWLSNRIRELAFGSRYYNPHTLFITKPNEYFDDGVERKNSSGDNRLVASSNIFKAWDAENDLIISGYPSNFSPYQVAGILNEFRVLNVEISEKFAHVELGSKFEVLQACKKFNGRLINETFVVKLTPNNVAIVEKFNEIYNS